MVVAGGTEVDSLFRELYIPAYAVALRILRDPHAAEDAACEAMARSVASWRRLQGVEHQRAYVLRVTANVAIDVIRRSRTVPMASPVDARTTTFASEERMVLVDALTRLPRRQREVLVLRFLADMSEAQVAEHLCISLGSVKQHARRGLAAMRDALAPLAVESSEVSFAT